MTFFIKLFPKQQTLFIYPHQTQWVISKRRLNRERISSLAVCVKLVTRRLVDALPREKRAPEGGTETGEGAQAASLGTEWQPANRCNYRLIGL